MAANVVQISAYVSTKTKERLDATSRARGIKKAHLVEQALLHYLTALDQLPAGFVIPARIVLKADAFAHLVEDFQADIEPTQALSDLFNDD